MQRNKYLDELGIPIEGYGVNFLTSRKWKRKAKWRRQRKNCGFDERECYDLGGAFVEGLYSRLRMYKDSCSEIIDLTAHKFEFDGQIYTQEEAIDFITKRLGAYIAADYACDTSNWEKNVEGVSDAIRMWSLIWRDCWW